MQDDHRHGVLFRQLGARGVAFRRAQDQGLTEVGELATTRRDRIDEARHGRVRLRQAPLGRLAQFRNFDRLAGALQVVLPHQERHRVGREQLLGQAAEHAALKLGQAQAASIRATARLARPSAAQPVLRQHRVGPTAHAAAHQSREQVARPPPPNQRAARPRLSRVLDALPQLVVDDAQLRHLHRLVFVGGVRAGDAPAAFRVPQHADPVVDVAADIDRVVQKADLAAAVADDRGGPPLTAARRGDALRVQLVSDGPRRSAVGIVAQHAADDDRLVRVDAPHAGVDRAVRPQLSHDVVAVAQPAGDPAARQAAALAAPDLVGQVLQEQRAHRALQADVELVDDALAQGAQGNAGEDQALVDGRDVRLVAGHAVERLRQHHVEGPGGRVSEKRVQSGPPIAGARDGEVGVDLHDRPALALGMGSAVADLVFGRAFGLSVGREARVDGTAVGLVGHGRLLVVAGPTASEAAISRAMTRTRSATAG